MSLSTRPFPCLVPRREGESAVCVPARIRHAAVEHIVDRANGDHRQAEFPRTVDDPGSHEWNAVDRIHIRGEKERVELRVMAKTPHRIFAVYRPRGRRGTIRAIVPRRPRRQIACEMPTRIATQMRATVKKHDDAKVTRGVVVEQAVTGWYGIWRRIGRMEIGVVPDDPDDEDRETRADDVGSIAEQTTPDRVGPLPHLEITHLDGLPDSIIPPLRRGEFRVHEIIPQETARLLGRPKKRSDNPSPDRRSGNP